MMRGPEGKKLAVMGEKNGGRFKGVKGFTTLQIIEKHSSTKVTSDDVLGPNHLWRVCIFSLCVRPELK